MTKFHKPLLAMALAAFSVGSVYAQSSGGSGGAAGGGVTSTTDTFQGWLNKHAGGNKGRVTRQMYMEESGRRWDAMDRDKSGLTTEQIYGMYGPPAVMGGPTANTQNQKKGLQQ